MVTARNCDVTSAKLSNARQNMEAAAKRFDFFGATVGLTHTVGTSGPDTLKLTPVSGLVKCVLGHCCLQVFSCVKL